MIVCDSSAKPLVLFHLIHARDVRNALVFTKSAESTARLVRLFEFFESIRGENSPGSKAVVAQAYSSDLAPSKRKAILEQFKSQGIHMYVTLPVGPPLSHLTERSSMSDRLICSDLISRGIDISHVSHVVSYDVPVDFRKYVHRVGRTARAGRAGDAWTLVEEQEVSGRLYELDYPSLLISVYSRQARHFKSMLKEAAHLDRVKRLRIGESDLAPLQATYEVRDGSSVMRSLV